ncbi:hypothetical protein QCD79_24400, partial [Pseudomonas quasicaspiana]|nr:hypothetical protein [Pseudomonas quasicaspiana]
GPAACLFCDVKQLIPLCPGFILFCVIPRLPDCQRVINLFSATTLYGLLIAHPFRPESNIESWRKAFIWRLMQTQ